MIGTESQKRTDTLTSGGAVMSLVTGGPSPQITTTAAITVPATSAVGSALARAGTVAAVAAGAPALTRRRYLGPPAGPRSG